MKHLLFVLLLAIGCTETAPDTVERQDPLTAAEFPVPSAPSTELATQAERKAKAEWTGEVAPQTIDWAEANRHPRVKDGLIPAGQTPHLNAASLPVLLPQDDQLLASVALSTGDLWYGADMNADGIHVFVHGSRGAFPIDLKLSAEQRENIQNFTIYRSHEIVTLTFQMYGAAYRIDVECDKPTNDARCNQDAFVTQMAETLVLAGGQP